MSDPYGVFDDLWDEYDALFDRAYKCCDCGEWSYEWSYCDKCYKIHCHKCLHEHPRTGEYLCKNCIAYRDDLLLDECGV